MNHFFCYLFGLFWMGIFALIPVIVGIAIVRALLDSRRWYPPTQPQ